MRRRLTHALSTIFEGYVQAPLAVKVPQIAALFWVIKVTSTAMGLSRCSAITWAMPSAAFIPGSMTTHSVPGPVAAT